MGERVLPAATAFKRPMNVRLTLAFRPFATSFSMAGGAPEFIRSLRP
jgi:hypothetical protein